MDGSGRPTGFSYSPYVPNLPADWGETDDTLHQQGGQVRAQNPGHTFFGNPVHGQVMNTGLGSRSVVAMAVGMPQLDPYQQVAQTQFQYSVACNLVAWPPQPPSGFKVIFRPDDGSGDIDVYSPPSGYDSAGIHYLQNMLGERQDLLRQAESQNNSITRGAGKALQESYQQLVNVQPDGNVRRQGLSQAPVHEIRLDDLFHLNGQPPKQAFPPVAVPAPQSNTAPVAGEFLVRQMMDAMNQVAAQIQQMQAQAGESNQALLDAISRLSQQIGQLPSQPPTQQPDIIRLLSDQVRQLIHQLGKQQPVIQIQQPDTSAALAEALRQLAAAPSSSSSVQKTDSVDQQKNKPAPLPSGADVHLSQAVNRMAEIIGNMQKIQPVSVQPQVPLQPPAVVSPPPTPFVPVDINRELIETLKHLVGRLPQQPAVSPAPVQDPRIDALSEAVRQISENIRQLNQKTDHQGRDQNAVPGLAQDIAAIKQQLQALLNKEPVNIPPVPAAPDLSPDLLREKDKLNQQLQSQYRDLQDQLQDKDKQVNQLKQALVNARDDLSKALANGEQIEPLITEINRLREQLDNEKSDKNQLVQGIQQSLDDQIRQLGNDNKRLADQLRNLQAKADNAEPLQQKIKDLQQELDKRQAEKQRISQGVQSDIMGDAEDLKRQLQEMETLLNDALRKGEQVPDLEQEVLALREHLKQADKQVAALLDDNRHLADLKEKLVAAEDENARIPLLEEHIKALNKQLEDIGASEKEAFEIELTGSPADDSEKQELLDALAQAHRLLEHTKAADVIKIAGLERELASQEANFNRERDSADRHRQLAEQKAVLAEKQNQKLAERNKEKTDELSAVKDQYEQLRRELMAALAQKDQLTTRQEEVTDSFSEENDHKNRLINHLETQIKQQQDQLTEAEALRAELQQKLKMFANREPSETPVATEETQTSLEQSLADTEDMMSDIQSDLSDTRREFSLQVDLSGDLFRQYQDELHDLKAQLEQKDHQISDLSESMENARRQHENAIQDLLNQNTDEAERFSDQLQAVENRLVEAHQEKETLEKRIQDFEYQVSDDHQEKNALREQKTNAEEQLKRQENVIAQLEEEKQDALQAAQKQMAEVEQLLDEKQGWEKENGELRAVLRQQESAVHQYKQELEEAQTRNTEYDRTRMKLREAEQQVQKFDDQLVSARVRLESAVQSGKLSDEEKDRQIAQLIGQSSEAAEKALHLEEELENIQLQIEKETKAARDDFEREKKQFESDIDQAALELDQIKQEKTELQRKLTDQETEFQKASESSTEKAQILEAEVKALKDEINRKDGVISELTTKNQELETAYKKLQKECEELKHKIHELSESKKVLEQKNDQFKQAEHRNEEEITTLRQSLEQQKKAVTGAAEQLAQQEVTFKDQKHDWAEKSDALHKEIEKEKQKTEQGKSANDGLSQRVRKLKNDLAQREKDRAGLEGKVAELAINVEQHKKRTERAEKELAAEKARHFQGDTPFSAVRNRSLERDGVLKQLQTEDCRKESDALRHIISGALDSSGVSGFKDKLIKDLEALPPYEGPSSLDQMPPVWVDIEGKRAAAYGECADCIERSIQIFEHKMEKALETIVSENPEKKDALSRAVNSLKALVVEEMDDEYRHFFQQESVLSSTADQVKKDIQDIHHQDFGQTDPIKSIDPKGNPDTFSQHVSEVLKNGKVEESAAVLDRFIQAIGVAQVNGDPDNDLTHCIQREFLHGVVPKVLPKSGGKEYSAKQHAYGFRLGRMVQGGVKALLEKAKQDCRNEATAGKERESARQQLADCMRALDSMEELGADDQGQLLVNRISPASREYIRTVIAMGRQELVAFFAKKDNSPQGTVVETLKHRINQLNFPDAGFHDTDRDSMIRSAEEAWGEISKHRPAQNKQQGIKIAEQMLQDPQTAADLVNLVLRMQEKQHGQTKVGFWEGAYQRASEEGLQRICSRHGFPEKPAFFELLLAMGKQAGDIASGDRDNSIVPVLLARYKGKETSKQGLLRPDKFMLECLYLVQKEMERSGVLTPASSTESFEVISDPEKRSFDDTGIPLNRRGTDGPWRGIAVNPDGVAHMHHQDVAKALGTRQRQDLYSEESGWYGKRPKDDKITGQVTGQGVIAQFFDQCHSELTENKKLNERTLTVKDTHPPLIFTQTRQGKEGFGAARIQFSGHEHEVHLGFLHANPDFNSPFEQEDDSGSLHRDWLPVTNVMDSSQTGLLVLRKTPTAKNGQKCFYFETNDAGELICRPIGKNDPEQEAFEGSLMALAGNFAKGKPVSGQQVQFQQAWSAWQSRQVKQLLLPDFETFKAEAGEYLQSLEKAGRHWFSREHCVSLCDRVATFQEPVALPAFRTEDVKYVSPSEGEPARVKLPVSVQIMQARLKDTASLARLMPANPENLPDYRLPEDFKLMHEAFVDEFQKQVGNQFEAREEWAKRERKEHQDFCDHVFQDMQVFNGTELNASHDEINNQSFQSQIRAMEQSIGRQQEELAGFSEDAAILGQEIRQSMQKAHINERSLDTAKQLFMRGCIPEGVDDRQVFDETVMKLLIAESGQYTTEQILRGKQALLGKMRRLEQARSGMEQPALREACRQLNRENSRLAARQGYLEKRLAGYSDESMSLLMRQAKMFENLNFTLYRDDQVEMANNIKTLIHEAATDTGGGTHRCGLRAGTAFGKTILSEDFLSQSCSEGITGIYMAPPFNQNDFDRRMQTYCERVNTRYQRVNIEADFSGNGDWWKDSENLNGILNVVLGLPRDTRPDQREDIRRRNGLLPAGISTRDVVILDSLREFMAEEISGGNTQYQQQYSILEDIIAQVSGRHPEYRAFVVRDEWDNNDGIDADLTAVNGMIPSEFQRPLDKTQLLEKLFTIDNRMANGVFMSATDGTLYQAAQTFDAENVKDIHAKSKVDACTGNQRALRWQAQADWFLVDDDGMGEQEVMERVAGHAVQQFGSDCPFIVMDAQVENDGKTEALVRQGHVAFAKARAQSGGQQHFGAIRHAQDGQLVKFNPGQPPYQDPNGHAMTDTDVRLLYLEGGRGNDVFLGDYNATGTDPAQNNESREKGSKYIILNRFTRGGNTQKEAQRMGRGQRKADPENPQGMMIPVRKSELSELSNNPKVPAHLNKSIKALLTQFDVLTAARKSLERKLDGLEGQGKQAWDYAIGKPVTFKSLSDDKKAIEQQLKMQITTEIERLKTDEWKFLPSVDGGMEALAVFKQTEREMQMEARKVYMQVQAWRDINPDSRAIDEAARNAQPKAFAEAMCLKEKERLNAIASGFMDNDTQKEQLVQEVVKQLGKPKGNNNDMEEITRSAVDNMMKGIRDSICELPRREMKKDKEPEIAKAFPEQEMMTRLEKIHAEIVRQADSEDSSFFDVSGDKIEQAIALAQSQVDETCDAAFSFLSDRIKNMRDRLNEAGKTGWRVEQAIKDLDIISKDISRVKKAKTSDVEQGFEKWKMDIYSALNKIEINHTSIENNDYIKQIVWNLAKLHGVPSDRSAKKVGNQYEFPLASRLTEKTMPFKLELGKVQGGYQVLTFTGPAKLGWLQKKAGHNNNACDWAIQKLSEAHSCLKAEKLKKAQGEGQLKVIREALSKLADEKVMRDVKQQYQQLHQQMLKEIHQFEALRRKQEQLMQHRMEASVAG
ncbi:Chromosome partition protein Smc [invertebrate metagenome]|uniref:Chromosome partition protein Smc n=1 Tax=invertebrate metagenome TaxID=1711999 RepID=A0A2H9TBJ3_9ZZZZ